jgi:tetratricopeptide (TPR) repeat protein
VTDSLYEQYKEALRRGHVASQGGHLDEALGAYGEAAGLAPDRALPLVGIASVLMRLGKAREAATAYGKALDRAPADEAALRGRAEALVATGDRVRAAEALDRLATLLEGSGRGDDGVDAARRALDLAESRDRRATLQAMVDRLRADADRGGSRDVIDRA